MRSLVIAIAFLWTAATASAADPYLPTDAERAGWTMSDMMPDDLWRDFPKTAPAFEARFKTEEDCRVYWIKARWGGKPACAKCKCEHVWPIRNGTTQLAQQESHRKPRNETAQCH